MKPKILIVGSGPSGLSIAKNLGHRDFELTVFEKEEVVAASWQTMPSYIRLVSPPNASGLSSKDFLTKNPMERISAKEFSEYLTSFAQENQILIQLGTEVLNIEKVKKLWKVQTNKGDFEFDAIIWATGYFSTPYIPKVFQSDSLELPIYHTKSLKDAKQLVDTGVKDVLIVGKRLSAGQILEELSQVGIKFDLSLRNPLEHSSPPPVSLFFFRFMNSLEKFWLKFMKSPKFEADVKMEYSAYQTLQANKKTKCLPEVVALEGKNVTFKNKVKKKYDAIILATGFSPSLKGLGKFSQDLNLSNLKNNFEHPLAEKLFFLGFSCQTNFRSRFLRGIREDSAQLADHIKGAFQ